MFQTTNQQTVVSDVFNLRMLRIHSMPISLAPRSHGPNVVNRKSPQVEGHFGSRTLAFIMSTPDLSVSCFSLFQFVGLLSIHSVLQDAMQRPSPLARLGDSELISLRVAVHGGRLVLQPWPYCSGCSHHQCARSLHLGLPPQHGYKYRPV